MAGSVWSLLGMLAAVILVLVLAYWATRWIGTAGTPGYSTGRIRSGGREDFRVLAQIGLGRNERLVLVQLRDNCCLIGVTAGQITLLKELEGGAAEEMRSAMEAPGAPGFVDILKETLRKRK